MREIKFRAWDNVQEKMLPVERINFREQYVSLDEGDNSVTDTFEIFDIMQYTGKNDKNGVEIYEGDIVKINEDGNCNIYSIIYSKNRLGFTFSNGCGFGLAFGLEVIGNIYENPELLEDAK